MSTYWKMWEYINSMTEDERQEFIKEHGPAKGVDISLPDGTRVLDVDILEAARNCD